MLFRSRAGRTIVAGLCCGAAAIVFAVGLFDIDHPSDRLRAAEEPDKTVGKTEPEPPQKVSRRSDKSAPPMLSLSKEVTGDIVKIRGTVLRPDGSPAAGAKISAVHSVYFNRVSKRRSIASISTEADGRFALVYRRSQYGKKPGEPDQWDEITIVAEADGCSLEWLDQMRVNASKPLVFNLAPDFPIHGRVLDLQAQPVANAAVAVEYINTWVEGNLDSWLDELKRGATHQTRAAGIQRTERPPHDLASPWAITDRDGRFVIRGIRAERHVTLIVQGESIAYHRLSVVTRNMPTLKRDRTNFEFLIDRLYGADFTYMASPGRPIEGIVCDSETRRPLAGVEVRATLRDTQTRIELDLASLTDEKGHYRLVSLPIGEGNGLFLTPSDALPYFMRRVEVPHWGESEPRTFDVSLHRGIWISGKATDKVTKKPVVARIYYFPFLNNPFANKLPEYHNGNVDGDENRYWTRADGSFRLVGLPGRAIVGALASGGTRYRAGIGASEIGGMNKEEIGRAHV